MDRHRLILKIAEMRSYIASDWPSVEERKRLYRAVEEIEKMLSEADDGDSYEKNSPQK